MFATDDVGSLQSSQTGRSRRKPTSLNKSSPGYDYQAYNSRLNWTPPPPTTDFEGILSPKTPLSQISRATPDTPSTSLAGSPAWSHVSSTSTAASSYSPLPRLASFELGFPEDWRIRSQDASPTKNKTPVTASSSGFILGSDVFASPTSIPPEFAHLNYDTVPSSPRPIQGAPRRPSREHAPLDYEGMGLFRPIVHTEHISRMDKLHIDRTSPLIPSSPPSSSSSRKLRKAMPMTKSQIKYSKDETDIVSPTVSNSLSSSSDSPVTGLLSKFLPLYANTNASSQEETNVDDGSPKKKQNGHIIARKALASSPKFHIFPRTQSSQHITQVADSKKVEKAVIADTVCTTSDGAAFAIATMGLFDFSSDADETSEKAVKPQPLNLVKANDKDDNASLSSSPAKSGRVLVSASRSRDFGSFSQSPLRKDSLLSFSSSSISSSFGVDSQCSKSSTSSTWTDSSTGADDIWDEYDDLLDEIMAQSKLVPITSAAVSHFRTLSQSSNPSLPLPRCASLQSLPTLFNSYCPPKTTNSRPTTAHRRNQSSIGGVGCDRAITALRTGDFLNPDNVLPFAETELRLEALTTSRLLSSGKTMFSPAHSRAVKGGVDVRILIIDGMNQDWSLYCALTYPKSTFYSLCTSTTSSPHSNLPSNLHPLTTTSTSLSSLPFPSSFFTAVIFRFPLSTSSKADLTSMISESSRVLQPGGHIEIACLEQDLISPGALLLSHLPSFPARTESSKKKSSCETVLSSIASDKSLKGAQRCVVGIPTTSSSLTNTLPNDKDVMFPRVGRYWYDTCFSSTKHIWERDDVQRECKDLGTSFKFVLCQAQKEKEVV